jgi:hypothetical protein
MFRRSILMATVGLALLASPALASCHWHSQMKLGTATASRNVGKGCSVRAGSHWGSLWVTCSPKHHASLTYLFSGTRKVYGQARVGIDAWGTAKLTNVVKASSSSIQVTVTVSGSGTTLVDSVSVGYYAH